MCPIGAQFFHVGGQTGRKDEVISRFLQFCEGA